MHFDQVCYDFPDLRIVMRHGAEPWEDLAVKLMLKWPGLYYMTSAFAPKYYPPAIVEYANTRGTEKIMYAGYYPMGLDLDRIFAELPDVPLRDHVWSYFLRENAMTVFKLREPHVSATRKIPYAGSVHDEREVAAVCEVLRGGPQALRIGRQVRDFEQRIAELFGKRRGIMCNSGSSALYLAVELLGLAPGDEVITSAVTFSTDVAPLVRAGVDAGVCGCRGRHVQHRRRRDSRDDRTSHQGHLGAQPDWKRSGLGRHSGPGRPARPRGRRGLLRRARAQLCGAGQPAPAPISR